MAAWSVRVGAGVFAQTLDRPVEVALVERMVRELARVASGRRRRRIDVRR
jgi:hypothetical protein